jgi:chromosome segregation ATPase
VQPEALDRARKRLAEAGTPGDPVALDTTIERARLALETLAAQTSELESAVPEKLDAAIREGLRTEARPIGRQLAEVRGLSNGTTRRLERLQHDLDAERRARVEDLALLVDLIASGWHGVERRLDRLERSLDRLERSLEDRPPGEVYRFDRRSGA